MSERAAMEVVAAMRKRHPNAAPDDEPICGTVDDGFVCTREQGHRKRHEAHGSFGSIAHAWAQTTQTVDTGRAGVNPLKPAAGTLPAHRSRNGAPRAPEHFVRARERREQAQQRCTAADAYRGVQKAPRSKAVPRHENARHDQDSVEQGSGNRAARKERQAGSENHRAASATTG